MRQIIAIRCEGRRLLATLDGPADASLGWLFAVGGSQTRVGPHRLYERLALHLAGIGDAVIRFDRRGVGDSDGDDLGYLESGPDLKAAQAALQSYFPHIQKTVGFGLCDGATAIALHGPRLDGAVLANPWVVEPVGDMPPAAAIRGHYRKRLLDPRAWTRLLSGGVDVRKLMRGMIRAHVREDDSLVRRVAAGLPRNTQILLAEGDGTAQAFAAAWKALGKAVPPAIIQRVSTSSHSFADAAAFEALASALHDYSAATASSASKSASAR